MSAATASNLEPREPSEANGAARVPWVFIALVLVLGFGHAEGQRYRHGYQKLGLQAGFQQQWRQPCEGREGGQEDGTEAGTP
jgi:hypothetical protein